MLKLIYNIFTSPFVKVLFKFIASLASAIAVISGYLVFVNRNYKGRQEDEKEQDDLTGTPFDIEIPPEDEEDE